MLLSDNVFISCVRNVNYHRSARCPSSCCGAMKIVILLRGHRLVHLNGWNVQLRGWDWGDAIENDMTDIAPKTVWSTGSIEDLFLDEIQYSIVFYLFKPKLSKTTVIMCGVCQREEPCQLLCAPFAKYTPDMLCLARNVNNFYCISDMIVHHHQHHCQQNYRHREHNTMWSTKIII